MEDNNIWTESRIKKIPELSNEHFNGLIENYDLLIAASEEKIKLLREMKRALLNERHEYRITPNPTKETFSLRLEPFYLVSKTEKRILKGGAQKDLERYCLQNNLAYWLDLEK